MLFILYLILFFQLYYLHFSKSVISIDSIIIILITQVIISTIFYSKKKNLISLENLKIEIIYKNYKYGLLLLLSGYISCYSFILLYLSKKSK